MTDDASPGATPPGPPPPGVPPGYGQAPYWQPQPGYHQFPPPPGVYGPPKHPQATTSLILGIIALGGMMLCLLPILVAPVAWFMGAKSLNEIDANPQVYGGRGEANAGKILGIVGTVVLVLLVLAAVVLFGILALTSAAYISDKSGVIT